MPVNNISLTKPNDYSVEQAAIERQRRLAEMLQQKSLEPIDNPMAGGYVVPISPFQGLAKMLQAYGSGRASERLDERQAALINRRNADTSEDMTKLAEALAGKPATPPVPDDLIDPAIGTGQQGAPAVKPGINAALISALLTPEAKQLALTKLAEQSKPVVVGRSLVTPQGNVLATDETWAAEQDAARQQKALDAAAKQAEQQAAREDRARQEAARIDDRRSGREDSAALRRELAAQSSADRLTIAGMINARQEQKNTPKLPTSALKMQNEELDAIGTASAIQSDLSALDKQIESGKLDLGPVNNLTSRARNALGMSSEQSRNYASYLSTLEKLRNDSLRLNKGVQTEGDAQRAWNELISNSNDPKVVRQRLSEIQAINKRAAELRRLNIDNIRTNYGLEPLEVSGYQNQPAAVGANSAPPPGAVRRKN